MSIKTSENIVIFTMVLEVKYERGSNMTLRGLGIKRFQLKF